MSSISSRLLSAADIHYRGSQLFFGQKICIRLLPQHGTRTRGARYREGGGSRTGIKKQKMGVSICLHLYRHFLGPSTPLDYTGAVEKKKIREGRVRAISLCEGIRRTCSAFSPLAASMSIPLKRHQIYLDRSIRDSNDLLPSGSSYAK